MSSSSVISDANGVDANGVGVFVGSATPPGFSLLVDSAGPPTTAAIFASVAKCAAVLAEGGEVPDDALYSVYFGVSDRSLAVSSFVSPTATLSVAVIGRVMLARWSSTSF